ncbi:hypothetical protein [Acinetobacter thermotolerans]|uniref:hypothetical protein n=1 Tax=Acinetobacter thermotolerans TaxID=3151487 RepID=UPI00325A70E0
MTNIIEITKTNSQGQHCGVLQSAEDAKRADLNNRLANLSERVKVATRSIRNLEKERMTFHFKFKFR